MCLIAPLAGRVVGYPLTHSPKTNYEVHVENGNSPWSPWRRELDKETSIPFLAAAARAAKAMPALEELNICFEPRFGPTIRITYWPPEFVPPGRKDKDGVELHLHRPRTSTNQGGYIRNHATSLRILSCPRIDTRALSGAWRECGLCEAERVVGSGSYAQGRCES